MLRIHPMQSAAQAKSFYRQADYYTEEQELPGLWRGRGAKRLELTGTVEKEQFEALCDNLHPETGESLTLATRSNRTVGYDFNFHAPKSLSLLQATTNDADLLRVFQESVDETMQLIEADMQTRVRKDYQDSNRTTGEMVWARFDHFTARPIDGVPDPHLHSHCFVQNMTFDAVENSWKAGQFRELKRDAPYYQAVFHATLTARLRELDVPLEKTSEGWEIAGYSKETLALFSRRTQQIETLAEEKGITDAAEKAELGAKSREKKVKSLSMSELRAIWQARLDESGSSSLPTTTKPAEVGLTVDEALRFACEHQFERQSVVRERQLLGTMLTVGLGRFTLEEAQAALKGSDVIVREYRGERMATTQMVLAEETALLRFAREGRGRHKGLGLPNAKIERDWFNAGQKAAVQHLWTSQDRVMIVRGAAGVGKTTLMQEAVAGIERGGHQVLTFAPSASASRGVLRSEGFSNSETVAKLLVDQKLQEQVRGQVLWIDEAGLLGTQAMRQVFQLAESHDCRVILSGDTRQHGAVARGAVLKILEEQAGLPVAEVKEIQRQKGAYKEAVKLLSEGEAGEGLRTLDQLGWVKEVAGEDRNRQLAADYVAGVKAGKSVLVVSPTHAEGARITSEIRQALRAEGKLTGDDKQITRLVRVDLTEAERGQRENYQPGDVLQFQQNAKGFKKGEKLVVREGMSIPIEQAKRFQVFRPQAVSLAVGERIRITHGGQSRDGHKLENGNIYRIAGFTPRGDVRLHNGWVIDSQFGHLAHGYVTTSHASQGKTVDRVLIGQSSQSWGAASREQFYVSASRGREQVTVYTDDKAALRDAIEKSDDRISATELVASKRNEQTRRVMGRQREYRLRHLERMRQHERKRVDPEPVRKGMNRD
ncbi:MAG: MobF family relaxase [Fimbriiglobus sp.]